MWQVYFGATCQVAANSRFSATVSDWVSWWCPDFCKFIKMQQTMNISVFLSPNLVSSHFTVSTVDRETETWLSYSREKQLFKAWDCSPENRDLRDIWVVCSYQLGQECFFLVPKRETDSYSDALCKRGFQSTQFWLVENGSANFQSLGHMWQVCFVQVSQKWTLLGMQDHVGMPGCTPWHWQ